MEDRLITTYLTQGIIGRNGATPPAPPDFILGTATRRGTNTWAALHEAQDVLRTQLGGLGGITTSGYAQNTEPYFLEPIVFTSGLDLRELLPVVRKRRLEFFIERTSSEVRVISRDGEQVASGVANLITPRNECHMPNPDPTQVCTMNGGPWGSAAMAAASQWATSRARTIAVHGCHVCEDGAYYRISGQIRRGGGPIDLRRTPVATRFDDVDADQ